jgi:phosphoribosylaminoimidazole carboxylase PurE protein
MVNMKKRSAANTRTRAHATKAESESVKRESARTAKPLVGLLYGSASDEALVRECTAVLERFGISYETRLLSAHRMPRATTEYVQQARGRGLRVLIGAAGMAAHLPGVAASLTTLPVIGIPLCGSAFEGQDALLSMVQMPAGVPVATVAVGKAGAKNAAVLAAEILGVSDSGLARKLEQMKRDLEAGVKI